VINSLKRRRRQSAYFFFAFQSYAENARHETTGKETTAPKCPKMQGWKLRETETGTMLQGWKMRDMNIRERQSMESRWLLNTGKRGQRLETSVDSVRLTTGPLNQSL